MRIIYYKLSTILQSQWHRLFLVVASCAVLYPILFNGFAQRSGDDNWMVYENSFIRNLYWVNISYYFTHFYSGQYSPINTLYYALIYRFFGLESFWYHVFSLVLHTINALLVYIFIKRLIYAAQVNSFVKSRTATIAFCTALLFAIHPMQVESVAWISASKNLLYTFFSLLALLQYLQHAKSGRWTPYFIVVILYILAFGSKEQAAILPAALLLVDWYIGRNMRTRKYWLLMTLLFILGLGMGVISLMAQQNGFGIRLANEYYPFWQRIVLACYAFTEYLFKGILPIKLNFMYPFPMKPGEAMPLFFWFYPMAVACLGLLLIFAWKRGYKRLFFGLGFLLINLALALHIVPLARGVLVADRYFYLGSIGLFFTVSYYVLGWERLSLLHLRLDSRVLMGVYTLYMGLFAARYALHWT